jgi:hypothetical protein
MNTAATARRLRAAAYRAQLKGDYVQAAWFLEQAKALDTTD